jgi:hypothetical protein
VQNLLPKTPYKFKKSYGGTPEPQTPQDAPWLRGPSLKKYLACYEAAYRPHKFKNSLLQSYPYILSYLGKINVRVRRYAVLHKKYIVYGTKL